VALKKAGFISVDVQSHVLSPSRMHITFPLTNSFAEDILCYASPCVNEPLLQVGESLVSCHFHRSYLEANKVSKTEGIRKVNKYAYNF